MTPEQLQKILDNAPKWAVAVNMNNGMYYDKSEVSKGDIWLMDIHLQLTQPDTLDLRAVEYYKRHNCFGEVKMDKVKVLDGCDFRERWDGLFITLEDYENIDCDNYEQQLHDLFEYHSFSFDELKHEHWEVE